MGIPIKEKGRRRRILEENKHRPIEEIAKLLGVTPRRVYQLFQEYGIERPQTTQGGKHRRLGRATQEILERYKARPIEEVAQILGVSNRTAYEYYRKAGIRRTRRSINGVMQLTAYREQRQRRNQTRRRRGLFSRIRATMARLRSLF